MSKSVLLESRPGILLATFIALVFNKLGVTELNEALVYGVALWIAFPVVLLAGSVIHEKVPVMLASIHAGDWLVKLLFISSLVTVWN